MVRYNFREPRARKCLDLGIPTSESDAVSPMHAITPPRSFQKPGNVEETYLNTGGITQEGRKFL